MKQDKKKEAPEQAVEQKISVRLAGFQQREQELTKELFMVQGAIHALKEFAVSPTHDQSTTG